MKNVGAKKVLVLGAGGMLGHMVVRVLSGEHAVFGTTRGSHQRGSVLERYLHRDNWVADLDIRDDTRVEKLLTSLNPDVVINCVGLVKQKMDAHSYIESIEINALLPHRLAKLCELHNSKFIQVSTDCVFTCDQGIKEQTDLPNANDLYGRTKYLGEVNYGTALTLRTSIVGRQIEGRESFFEWVLSQKGNSAHGYKNALYTGLTTYALSKVIEEIIANHPDLSGLWQVASEPVSKFYLMKELNSILSLDINISENITFECDRRLNGEPFFEKTGIRIPTWKIMIQQFASDQVNYE